MIARFKLVVTVDLKSGRRLRFRADDVLIKYSDNELTEYEFAGADRRAMPRYLRIASIDAITWRQAILGLF